VELPPDGTPAVTRSPASRAAGVAVWVTAACLILLALLGAGIRSDFEPQLRLDAAVSEEVYVGDDRAGALNGVLEVLTAPGSWWVRALVLLPSLVYLLRRRLWWTAGWVATAAVLVGPLTTGLKEYFGRIRPPFEEGGARYDSLSFPSGHASGIAALVTVALVLTWPLLGSRARAWSLTAGVALVVTVGLTRMWLGVHYLSDVVGGWSFGVAWTLGTALLFGALSGGRAALR
jgi:membrane-associated phospholipid phosphatase